MKKLYFLTNNHRAVAQLRDRLGIPVEQLGQYTLLSNHPDDQRQPRLAAAGILRRSDMLGLFWRGGFWAALATLLVLAALLPERPGSAGFRQITVYALLVFGVAFGAWLGGLLGLMRANPEYRPWIAALDQGHYLVAIVIRPERERMLRRQMAECGWRCVAETVRYAGSFRFPQNRADGVTT